MTRYEVVYTTDPNDCPRCHQKPCRCKAPPPDRPLEGQTARLRVERGGRRGKVVTVISNLVASPARLRDLLRDLQKACGTGGTVRPDGLEIQGDHRDRLTEHLKALGLKVR